MLLEILRSRSATASVFQCRRYTCFGPCKAEALCESGEKNQIVRTLSTSVLPCMILAVAELYQPKEACLCIDNQADSDGRTTKIFRKHPDRGLGIVKISFSCFSSTNSDV